VPPDAIAMETKLMTIFRLGFYWNTACMMMHIDFQPKVLKTCKNNKHMTPQTDDVN
jgi:hypothetical protein